MVRLTEIVSFLDALAPTQLAEEWDNVGLLVGDRERDVSKIMTCLTLTPDVAAEAIDQGAELVVSHHPLMFRPVQRISTDTIEGRLLLDLIGAGVAVHSPHTSYDSAAGGINRQLAELFDLQQVGVLRPSSGNSNLGDTGGGRYGTLATVVALSKFVETVKHRLGAPGVQYVGDAALLIQKVAVACGSAAEFLADAKVHGCDVLLTGEARFHACLEARSIGISLILAGHYATERPGVEQLAKLLARQFPALQVWASRNERDPLHCA